MIDYEQVKDFWDYIEYYPDEDEEGFDGIHYGGIKGLVKNAPKKAKKAYKEFLEKQNQNIKL